MIAAIDLSSNIFLNDMLESDDTSVAKILTWLLSRVGDVNMRLGTKIQVSGNDFSPQLTDAQACIFAVLYLYYYYLRQAKINAGAGAYSVLEVREGDSDVRFVNKNEIAKTFRGLAQDTLLNLNKLCLQYRQNSSLPVSINNPLFFNYSSFLYSKQVDSNNIPDNAAPINYE